MRIIRNITLVVFFFLLLLSGTNSTRAQIYEFRNFDVRHGLYNAKVNTIFEDQTGYLWVGTGGGLYRFNGSVFEILDTDNGLPHPEVTSLYEENGYIYAGTKNGIAVIKDFRVTRTSLEGEEVLKVFDHLGRRVAVVSDAVYDLSGSEPEMIYGTLEDRLITAVSYDSALWIATSRDGLLATKEVKGLKKVTYYNQKTYPGSPRRISDMVVTPNNELWIASMDTGIVYFDHSGFNHIRFGNQPHFSYSSIAYDSLTNSFWCGTWGSGLINISPVRIQQYTVQNGLPDLLIKSTYVSPSGMIYIGTITQGLSQFPGSSTIYFNDESGLLDNNVKAIATAEDQVYVSTSHGVSVFDNIGMKSLEKELDTKYCGPLLVLPDGKLLIGKYSGMIQSYQNGVGGIYLDNDQIGSEVHAMEEYRGLVFIASGSRLYVYNGSDPPTRIAINEEIERIYCLYAYDNLLAIGTTKGVFIYDIRKKKSWKFRVNGDTDSDVIGNSVVNQIGGEKRPDALLIATENSGIFLYDTALRVEPIRKLNTKVGLYSNTVRAFTMVGKNLILASNTDVIKIEFIDDGTEHITKMLDVTEFGHKEINRGALMHLNGQLWVGTGFGVVRFNYDRRSQRRESTPKIYLRHISGMERSYSVDSLEKIARIEFSPAENDFEFTVNGINLNTGESYYKFWLEGFEHSWRKPSSDPVVTYNNLPPGKYVFHYMLQDTFGNKSEARSFAFVIESPYWKNWRFLLLVVGIIIVFFGIVLFVFRERNETIIERVSVKQSLYVNRLIIFFGALAYPAITYLNVILDDRIASHEFPIAFGIGVVLMAMGLLTFRSKSIIRYQGQIVIIGHLFILGHLLVSVYMTNLVPSLVVSLIVVISFASIVYHAYRDIIIFSILLMGIVVWIAFNVVDPYFLPTQFIISVIAALLISILIISIRLSLFSRLANSDSILQNIDNLVLVADKDGDIQFVSGSITKLLGYSREEVMGKGWWDIRGKEEKAKHLSRNQSSGGKQRQYVTQVTHKNGEKRHYRWIESVLSNGHVAGVGHDITEAYHLEKEMERLSIVAKETASGVVITNNRNLIEWVNTAMLDITGYAMEDLIGRRPLNVFSNDHLPDSEKIDLPENHERTGSYELELLCYKKDDTPIWLSIMGTPIFDSNGVVTQVVEVVQDITEKKEKDAQLQQLSLVAQQTDNYVMITSAEDEVIWVNDSFTKIFEYTSEEVVGRKVSEFLSLENLNPEITRELRKAIFIDKGNFVGEFCDKTKSGNIIWVSADVNVVLDDDGEIDHIISLGSNITDRKLKEFQIEQYGRSNALLHGIDSILIKEDDNETVINNILGLILEKDANILTAVYFEISFDENRSNMLIRQRNEDYQRWENVDISDYSSLPTLLQGKIFIADNIMDLDELSESDKWLMLNGVRSYIMVPIIVANKVIGTLGTGARTPHYFSDNDIETYQSIADSMAIVYQQKEQAEKIRENEENFRQINESISEAFWLLDAIKNQIIYVNSTLLEFFEITREEIMKDPRNWTKRVHPRDKNRVVKAFNEKASKDQFDEEFRVLKSDFSIRWVRAKAFTIRDAKGKIIRMSGSAQDITEQKKTEKAILELNEQLTSINVLNNSILNDKSIGEELYGIVQSMFNFTEILRLNILLFDYDKQRARYHFLLSNTSELYQTDSFPISNISSENIDKLMNFEYAWVEDLKSRKDLSDSDTRMIESGIESYLMYPLIHNAKLIGSLNISFASSFRLETEAVRFIKLISEGISISLYQKVLQDQISKDKQQLEVVHKDLSDSISYAKRFQDVRLPDLSQMRNVFRGADVLYMPKDVVSGDFYWEGVHEGNLIFAAADCTGHGVPGAFMTMLFNSMLDNVIYDKNILQPHEILLSLNEAIKSYFGSSIDSGIRDGMDIALCRYEILTGKLFFAGARRPFWIYRKSTGKIERLEGAIMSIGEVGNINRHFKTVEVVVEKDDVIYLTTDGYFDQFSADNRYKFGKRNFANLVTSHSEKGTEEIVEELHKNLLDWKGDNYQIDDILVLVIKV